MELYRRVSQGQPEPEIQPETETEIHMISITNAKPKDYVKRASLVLSKNRGVVLSGKGRFLNKTISVGEMLKRQFLQKNSEQLVQDTRIFRENAVDRWDPIIPELDSIQVVRSLPCITITLKKPQVT